MTTEREELAHVKALNALLLDALDHITRAVDGSRTNTRRLRWIKERALGAMRGEAFVKGAHDLPANAPGKDESIIRQKTEKARALRQALNMLRAAINEIMPVSGDASLDDVWKAEEPETFAEYQQLRAVAWPEGQGEPAEER